MKLYINTVIYRETAEQIKRWAFHLKQTFENTEYSYQIVVLTKRKNEIEQLLSEFPLRIIEDNEEMPYFLRVEAAIEDFLKENWGDYYVLTDIDTIFLGFKEPNKLALIEGQWLRYLPEHQKNRWKDMPRVWRERNLHFKNRNYLDSVHGAFIMLAKTICKQLELLFWKEPFDWCLYMREANLVDSTKLRGSLTSRNIISQEHLLGWYFYQLGLKIQSHDQITGVDKERKYYNTYRGEIDTIKTSTLIFHPVKDIETYRALIEKTGIESYE